MPFQQFGLHPSLVKNLREIGYTNPTPIQTQAIPPARDGRDLVATAQTGTGKTAAFLLPVMHGMLNAPRRQTAALVLTPTRELAQQIDANFRRLAAGTALRSALVIGGAAEMPQVRALRGNVDLVVATPGRMLAHLRDGVNPFAGLRTLVLDEADQMFDLGFLPDVRRIVSFLPANRQTLLFSATMPPEVEQLGRALQRDPLSVAIGLQGAAADTVNQTVYPVPAHRKLPLLTHLLKRIDDPSVIVFTRTKHGAKKLAQALYEAGHEVGELHSGRTPAQRLRAMQGFRSRQYQVLVATNIAARGIDVRHITHVVSYDMPAAPEEHVHRIGRAGRAGDSGEAILFLSPEEGDQLARIERRLRKKLPRRHLADFDYAAAPAPRKEQRRPAMAGQAAARKPGKWGNPRPRKPGRGQGRG